MQTLQQSSWKSIYSVYGLPTQIATDCSCFHCPVDCCTLLSSIVRRKFKITEQWGMWEVLSANSNFYGMRLLPDLFAARTWQSHQDQPGDYLYISRGCAQNNVRPPKFLADMQSRCYRLESQPVWRRVSSGRFIRFKPPRIRAPTSQLAS